MKNLELELNKRLLIVESEKILKELLIKDQVEHNLHTHHNLAIKKGLKLICKGSELTEEIAIKYVQYWFNEMTDELFCRDYKQSDETNLDYQTALESFISAIEAKNMYWKNHELTDSITAPDIEEWKEAESRTFIPEKTLIFEIVNSNECTIHDGVWSEFDQDLKRI